jgi:hypothetical protein
VRQAEPSAPRARFRQEEGELAQAERIVEMTKDPKDKRPPGRRSASAEAAALRYSERDPDVLEPEPPPPVEEPQSGGPRRSASAEAAALRWRREHPDEED